MLATVVADPRQRRLAAITIAISLVAFAGAVSFARVPLVRVPAFIPAYEAVLVIVDAVTAILLLQQAFQLRSAAVLALAAGFSFDGLMTISHALSFPGLVTPSGWLGAGSQTTAWLYMFWHGGFPLFVMLYAGLRSGDRDSAPAALPAVYGIAALTAVVGGAVVLTLLAVDADGLLPPIMAGDSYTPVMKFVVGTVWVLTAASVLALVANRPYTVLDLWLIVVMIAWFADIGLSAVFNAGRFDVGFYAGRVYGLVAASFVLGAMLVETGNLYRRLAGATREAAASARELARRVDERTHELSRANRKLNAILEASPVAVVILDRDGNVVLWTSSAERLFGYGESEAIGRPPPYLTDQQLTDFRANFARAASQPTFTGTRDTRCRRKDGVEIDVRVRWTKVEDERGQMIGMLDAVADITEQRKIESQLRQAQKMEAIGTLTGGLAHDFNNHLGVIILNLDILGERVTGDPEAEELSSEALDAAMRGAELIRRLLAFARRQPLQQQRTDVNRLITEITKLLQRTLGEDIEIVLDLDDHVWPTMIDPTQLESALANLATNARDAMPNGGELTIASGNRRLDDDYAEQHAEVAPGDYAMIEISDTGSGMPPEVLGKVFEPFFTTKAPGTGTGLGLSMVYGFIKQSGGHINVYSEVGVGTTMRLYLPRADAEADAAPAPEAGVPVRGHGEAVLVVEDNPSLRRVVARQLAEIGYRVIEAEDVKTALGALESEPVNVLFTDIVMPGGNSGYELAHAVMARWPQVRIVLTSGFPEHRVVTQAALKNTTLLSKPYRREDLARVIAAALSQPAAAP